MRSKHTPLLMLLTLAACYDGLEETSFPLNVGGSTRDGSDADTGTSAATGSSGGIGETGDGETGDGETGDGETGDGDSAGPTGLTGSLDAEAVDPCEPCGCHGWSAMVGSASEVTDINLVALPDGGALVSTVTPTGLSLRRFAPDGALRWAHEFAGSVANARAAAIGGEFIAVAGTLTGPLVLDPVVEPEGLIPAGGADGFVALLSDSSDGGLSWAARFGDAADQRVGAIAVTGCTAELTGCRIQLAGVHGGQLGLGVEGEDTGTQLFHAQLDAFAWQPADATVWRIASAPIDNELPTLARAPDGTVTLVGTVRDMDPGDIVTRRIGPDEQELWSIRLAVKGEQKATAAAHAGDRLWLAGYAIGETDLGAGPFGYSDEGTAFIAGIDAEGAVVASRAVSGRLPSSQALATTPKGSVVVTGFTNADIDLGGGVLDFSGGTDLTLARFDAAGGYLCGSLHGDSALQEGVATASAAKRTLVLARIEGSIDFGDGGQASDSEALVLASFTE